MNKRENAAEFRASQDDVFARIAQRYDRLCDVFSLGIHRLWKRMMAQRISAERASALLDLAAGTGDIPHRLLERDGRPTNMLVSDLCPQMLDLARDKLGHDRRDVEFAILNAHKLVTIEDNRFDIVSISFGMKICDRAAVMSEAYRVLKPGGLFICLEAARIPNALLHRIYLTYMDLCMPLISHIATGGDASAYRYLLCGIHDFPDQNTLCAEFSSHGFEQVRYTNHSLGIVALHEGRKPSEKTE
ncbi:MAG: ubiquinone/menaquinone biosynthesis methyltransferase [Maricaulis sp.]|uniref:ubiquinone/menaquinone biosynthesis methyltransferase n=1 Tax=Maricaulis sp. TaxID=1486257 RepID=UPI00262590AB|nr:ubiquinone/menaquinone biosynthesis methyltransferase [Maricaulis sp.]MDM7984573.1 ubiquinone/menaquinone biosynthesis methyltransferase [Maricaulis sp.]